MTARVRFLDGTSALAGDREFARRLHALVEVALAPH